MPAELPRKIFTKKLQTVIFSLHGFLGTSHDMAYLHDIAEFFGKIDAPNLFSPHSSEISFGSLKGTIGSIYNRISSETSIKIGLGYSLGGRLILEVEKQYPDIFNKIIVISSHPGLNDEHERRARLEADHESSKTLIKCGFQQFVRNWNAKDVFVSTKKIERIEKDYSLQKLAHSLENFSLGHQLYDEAFLKRIACKTHVILGEYDVKFINAWADVKKIAPELSLYIVKNAGHRAFADNPNAVGEILRSELAHLCNS